MEERLFQIRKHNGLLVLQTQGQAVYKLRKDNAGVAPGIQKCSVGKALHISAYIRRFGCRTDSAAETMYHIGACITVGNRKYIQIVNDFHILLQIQASCGKNIM